MQWVNTEARYGALSQALHWATAICVTGLAARPVHGRFPERRRT
jgi:cytochrome b561